MPLNPKVLSKRMAVVVAAIGDHSPLPPGSQSESELLRGLSRQNQPFLPADFLILIRFRFSCWEKHKFQRCPKNIVPAISRKVTNDFFHNMKLKIA
jgi:hypothetical protein